MKISLMKGSFTASDFEKILTEMIHVKIKYHEDKIKLDDGEETIKMREQRIIQLQRDLFETRKYIQKVSGFIKVDAEVNIE